MPLLKITTADISVLQELCRRVYTIYFGDHWQEDGLELYLESQFNRKRLLTELENNSIGLYFILHNREPVGFIRLYFNIGLGEFSAIENCELEKMYILPEWKGKGLGKRSLQKAIEICQKMQKKILFLCVLDTNTDSIAFYKSLGFRFHSTIRLKELYFKEDLKGMHRMILEL